MPAPPGDALVATISAERIAPLAKLYDRFAHPLDPCSPERDSGIRPPSRVKISVDTARMRDASAANASKSRTKFRLPTMSAIAIKMEQMPTPPGDPVVESVSAERIALLAKLYDRFAHALDPYSPERDRAEQVFQQEIVDLYDRLQGSKPDLHAFKRAVILRCRRHLRASDKPPSV